jgi:predicted negative regulator of RcsB-dependent stress response
MLERAVTKWFFFLSFLKGMQGIPGVNMNQLSAAPAGTNAAQAYTDTMTALAMQQAAAAAAAGQQFVMQPGSVPYSMMAGMGWPQPSNPPQQQQMQTDPAGNEEKHQMGV